MTFTQEKLNKARKEKSRRRHYPDRSDGTDSLGLFHRCRPSPYYSWVSSCIMVFEACSAFTRVTTCRLTESPFATLYTGGSGGFVASTAAPIVTGWSNPVPRRVCLPLWTRAPSRRPVTAMLRQPCPSQPRTYIGNLHWDWYSKRGHFTSSSSRSPYAHLSKLTLMPILKMRELDFRGRFGEKVSLCASRRSVLLQPL